MFFTSHIKGILRSLLIVFCVAVDVSVPGDLVTVTGTVKVISTDEGQSHKVIGTQFRTHNCVIGPPFYEYIVIYIIGSFQL